MATCARAFLAAGDVAVGLSRRITPGQNLRGPWSSGSGSTGSAPGSETTRRRCSTMSMPGCGWVRSRFRSACSPNRPTSTPAARATAASSFTDQGRRIQHIEGAISTTFMQMVVGPQGIPDGHEILRWPEPAPVRGRVFSAWSRTWSGPRRRETSGSAPGSGSPSCPGP